MLLKFFSLIPNFNLTQSFPKETQTLLGYFISTFFLEYNLVYTIYISHFGQTPQLLKNKPGQ